MLNLIIVRIFVGTDIIGGDQDRDRDRDRANPIRNDDVPEVGNEKGTETRDDIESGGVVRETEKGKGATGESVPRGTRIAKENGTPSKRGFNT